jgi:hypothetical protein
MEVVMKREDNTQTGIVELGQASVLTEGNGSSGGDGAGQKLQGGLSDD